MKLFCDEKGAEIHSSLVVCKVCKDKMQGCDYYAAETIPFEMLDLEKEKYYLYLLTKFKIEILH